MDTNANSTSSNLFNVKEVMEILMGFLTPKKKIPDFPPLLIDTGVQFRGGLSPRKTFSNFLVAKADVGGYTGNMPDGSENIQEKIEFELIKAIYDSLQNDAKLIAYVRPGQKFVGNGTSGPVVGMTTTYGKVNGIIK